MYGSWEGQLMISWLGEVQVTGRLGSNLKSFLSLTLVDVKFELTKVREFQIHYTDSLKTQATDLL